MILNEKPLVRAMNEAWKGDGYTVVCYQNGGESWLGVITGDWIALAERSNVPRKVLGLIAEHVGEIPGEAEAWLVRKDEDAQMEGFRSAMASIEAMEERSGDSDELTVLKRTKLQLRRMRLWQDQQNGQIWMVDPENMNIAAAQKNQAFGCGHAVYVAGEVSRAYVFRARLLEGEENLLKHLGVVRWA